MRNGQSQPILLLPAVEALGPEVVENMDIILSKCRAKVKHIQSDQGKEFFCKSFQKAMDKWKINHFNFFAHLKASICERFIRTLKRKLRYTFVLCGNQNVATQECKLVLAYQGPSEDRRGTNYSILPAEEFPAKVVETM